LDTRRRPFWKRFSVHRNPEQGKGIDPQIVFDAVKDAMLIAARKLSHH
jgi:hypothetical protein